MATIIAKNQTVEDIPLSQLRAPDAKIPASGQVTLTDYNGVCEIQRDMELESYVQADDILLNDGTRDLTKSESLNFIHHIATVKNADLQVLTGNGSPNGVVFGQIGEAYYDITGTTFYRCTSYPCGTVWAVF